MVYSPIRPKPAGANANVAIFAASGPIERHRFEPGFKRLKRLFGTVSLPENLYACERGLFAGRDSVRLQQLRTVLANPDIDVVIAARGGSGVTRLLDRLDPGLLRDHPKLLVGFSDITGLLAWTLKCVGMTCIHGPVVTQVATLHPECLQRLQDMLAGEVPPALAAEQGTVLLGGCVEGPLFAGNIEVLRTLVGTRAMPDLRGHILALEEIGERPYRLDRALTQLMSSGALRGVKGIALGQLTGCEEPEGRPFAVPRAEDVVTARLLDLRIPVVTGFAFGHDNVRNQALPIGTMVRLDADNATLTCLEPCTRA